MELEHEQLLAEAPWVQRLARALVGDAQDADDLAQETLLAALRSGGPREAGALRAWLAAVLRRTAARSSRASARRA